MSLKVVLQTLNGPLQTSISIRDEGVYTLEQSWRYLDVRTYVDSGKLLVIKDDEGFFSEAGPGVERVSDYTPDSDPIVAEAPGLPGVEASDYVTPLESLTGAADSVPTSTETADATASKSALTCPICGEDFASERGLKKHLTMTHKEDSST